MAPKDGNTMGARKPRLHQKMSEGGKDPDHDTGEQLGMGKVAVLF